MALSNEELQQIIEVISDKVAEKMQEKQDLKEVEKQVLTTLQHAEKKQEKARKTKASHVKMQVQNRKPLAPTVHILTKAELKEIRHKERLEKQEQACKDYPMRQCSVCGEWFKPTTKVNHVCSNKLCKQINVYDQVIKKHVAQRMQELAQEEI